MLNVIVDPFVVPSIKEEYFLTFLHLEKNSTSFCFGLLTHKNCVRLD